MLGELYTTNKTYIALIPKKINSFKICDCRPISLVTSLYKIISKVLVFRLKNVLDSTISKTQGLLLPEGQILDVALIANEVVEDYRAKAKEGVVLKIDFEKNRNEDQNLATLDAIVCFITASW